MLEATNIAASYGKARVLGDVSLAVNAGEIVCLLGRNGAGKTTTLKTIMGLLPLQSGSVMLEDKPISGLAPYDIAKHRIGYVPQGRRLFGELTVSENIEVGLMVHGNSTKTRSQVLETFPRLAERLNQRADTLSGGEQQMLATARALCVEPKVLLLDEPTEGLQPSMIDQIRKVTLQLRAEGVAIILVEQRLDAVKSMADRIVFIENGFSRETITASELTDRNDLLQKYVGV